MPITPEARQERLSNLSSEDVSNINTGAESAHCDSATFLWEPVCDDVNDSRKIYARNHSKYREPEVKHEFCPVATDETCHCYECEYAGLYDVGYRQQSL